MEIIIFLVFLHLQTIFSPERHLATPTVFYWMSDSILHSLPLSSSFLSAPAFKKQPQRVGTVTAGGHAEHMLSAENTI